MCTVQCDSNVVCSSNSICGGNTALFARTKPPSHHSIVKYDTKIFSRVDESLLAGLVSAHAKVAKEVIYLETGTIPIRYIWAGRRLMYLHNILRRNKKLTHQKSL